MRYRSHTDHHLMEEINDMISKCSWRHKATGMKTCVQLSHDQYPCMSPISFALPCQPRPQDLRLRCKCGREQTSPNRWHPMQRGAIGLRDDGEAIRLFSIRARKPLRFQNGRNTGTLECLLDDDVEVCLGILPTFSWQLKPWRPNVSARLPHRVQLWGAQMGDPRQSEMVIQTESSDILSQREDTGRAESHAPDSLCCDANKRAFVLWSALAKRSINSSQ